MRRRELLASLLATAGGGLGLPAQASAPACSAPVKLVVGFAAGGGVDALARATATAIGPTLGCTVVVDNRPGAGGGIAATQVASAPADGSTLLFGDTALLVSQHANKSARYNVAQQFVPLARIAQIPLVLAVNSAVPVQTAQDFLKLVKEAPGKYSYGTAGVGSLHHLGGELLKQMAQIDWVHVAYKGGSPAVQDLVGGQIPFAISSIPAVLPHAKAGRVRLLAVMSDKRSAMLPEVPAMAEVITGFDATPSVFLLAPHKLPTEQRAPLEAAVLKALSSQTMQAALAAQGAIAAPLHRAAMVDWLASEDARWAQVVGKAGLRLD
jgi:tripartite-type tricarboxylate transporter receptor subunit TctC